MTVPRSFRALTTATAFRRAWFLVGLSLAAVGCRSEQLDASYGRRRGRPGAASVNGTAVFAQLFAQAGFRVTSHRILSPRMEQHEVIVWAPDDFGLPDRATVTFLEDWLQQSPSRTLIYIGRDYDAEQDYWARLSGGAPPEQAIEFLRRLGRARARHASARARMPREADSDWFRMRRAAEPRQIGRGASQDAVLRGRWQATDPVPADQVALRLHGRLEPPAADSSYRTEILLAADQDLLAYRLTHDEWPDGQLLVVANGSFLLNLPLVEPGHRRWAQQLIRACGVGRSVAFLESGPGGPPVLLQEPRDQYPTGLEAFTTWPLGAILWHFLALGIVFLFARLKIFGRPQQLPPEPLADFGRHVDALGELLASTGDESYARRERDRYLEKP